MEIASHLTLLLDDLCKYITSKTFQYVVKECRKMSILKPKSELRDQIKAELVLVSKFVDGKLVCEWQSRPQGDSLTKQNF